MATKEQKETPDDIALQIRKAARERFMHYGYNKTTMSEIAKDCSMSTGNLYRYFPSKMDIAEAIVGGIRAEQIARLKTIAASKKNPPKKLRTFLREKFKLAYDRFHDRPKAFELAQEILNDRPMFALEWERAESSILGDILLAGEASGDFAIGDPMKTARLIQDAAFRFTTSAVFHEGDYQALSVELDDVTDLILDAFAYRKMCAKSGV